MTSQELLKQVLVYFHTYSAYRVEIDIRNNNMSEIAALNKASLYDTETILSLVQESVEKQDYKNLDWGIKGLYFLHEIKDPMVNSFNVPMLEALAGKLQGEAIRKGEKVPGFNFEQTDALWSKPEDWPELKVMKEYLDKHNVKVF